jgi:2'-5' RNA ligase
MRAFIAISLTDEVRNGLADLASGLSSYVPKGAVRWVRPDQIHLTLRFLGETPAEKLPHIERGMDEAVSGVRPFTLGLDRIGYFPNQRRPRVIWVGLGGELAQLATLRACLDKELANVGIAPEDKAFRAHLTVGRVKDERALQGATLHAAVPRLVFSVSAIHLVESQLRPDGPIYTVQYSSPLKA